MTKHASNPIGRSYRRRRWRRALFELMGNYRYSAPGLNGLDTRLASRIIEKLPKCDRFFIEAGANDGFSQSNTYYLAKRYNWRGLLIEPIPEMAAHCRRIRSESTIVNCALGSQSNEGTTVQIHLAGLMSTVDGALGDLAVQQSHLDSAFSLQAGITQGIIEAPVRSLSSIIQEHRPTGTIDLLSLDVEGYEAQALSGLDLTVHRPTFICVEANDPDSISAILDEHYTMIAELSHHDRLYESNE